MLDSDIQLCITLDDLPVHGNPHPFLSRRDVARIFIETFAKHQLSSIVGFTNGGLTDSANLTKFLRAGDRKGCRRLLNLLVQANVLDIRAYQNGQFPETSLAHMEILKDWLGAGHLLGNHTYWHSDIDRTSCQLFIKSIEKNQELLSCLSANAKRIFRYPYLKEGKTAAKRDEMRRYLISQKYVVAPVTVDFGDWAWNRSYLRLLKPGATERLLSLEDKYIEMGVLALKSSVIASREIFGRDIKHIMLLHFGAFTAISLDRLLGRFSELGVQFVDINNALEDEAYRITPDVVLAKKGKSFLEQWRVQRNQPSCLINRSIYQNPLFQNQ